MKLLIFCDFGLYQNFSGSFVHQQVKAYAKLGHTVRVIIPIPFGKKDWNGSRLFSKDFLADGAALYPVRYMTLSKYGKWGFNVRAAETSIRIGLKSILSDFTPDIIHAHTLGFDSDVGAWLKERLHAPLVVTTHGSDVALPYQQGDLNWIRQKADCADVVVAVSSALAKKVQESGTKSKVRVVLNGFSADALPLQEEKVLCSVIQVGHLNVQKHFDVTIRAFALFHQNHPEAALTLVGQGAEYQNLKKLCDELNITHAVRFTGQISNEEVLKEMAKAQFFCMPSVREGFGIVYLEAMANGCLTIGTQGEGIADLIRDGENGFLLPPNNPAAIAGIWEDCLAHPAQAEMIAQKAKKDAMNLTWERNAQQYLALFKELM